MLNLEENAFHPMSFWTSLVYFTLPALLFVAGFWVLMPWLIRLGILPYYAYMLGLGLPLMFLFLTSLIWLRVEGRPLTWENLKDRYRLKKMDREDWLWSLGALAVGSIAGFSLVSMISDWLIQIGLMPFPANLPDFLTPGLVDDPRRIYEEAAGGIRGNWLLLVSMLVLFFFNIMGEELWWRGVVLPRQELVLGRWTWVVHGVLWAFFHIFKWWDVLNLLPITLALAFVASRQKSTTVGIVIHGVTNGIALIPLFLGVIGVV